MSNLKDDPLLKAGIAAHNLSWEDAPWHRSGLLSERQLDIGCNGVAPSIHVDEKFVFMKWALENTQILYSIEKQENGLQRSFQVEGASWPLSLIMSCEGRVLGELVSIQGAWEMHILSGWDEGNGSSSYEIAPSKANFLGNDDPTLIAGLTRMGVSRREIGDRLEYKKNTSRGECFIGQNRSYVTFISQKSTGLSYEIQRNGDGKVVKIYADGILAESVIIGMIGKQARDLFDLPHLGDKVIDAVEASAITTMTIFTIRPPS